MFYLIVQTFILLLVAALLGLLLGWYLTRISAASARSALQARVRAAEEEVRGLQGELDAMTTAKHNCDTERRLLSDEVAELRVRLDVAERAPGGAGIAAEARQQSPEADSAAIASAAQAALSGAQGLMAGAPTPADQADDLQQIRGIGPKIAGLLQELGVSRFEQIAAWSQEDVDWVNDRLRFKGRIEREEWIPQARVLSRK